MDSLPPIEEVIFQTQCHWVAPLPLPFGPFPTVEALYQHLANIGCYRDVAPQIPSGAPLFEEVGCPDGATALALPRWLQGTLLVDVTNTGEEALTGLAVLLHWSGSAPQPVALGGVKGLVCHGQTLSLSPEVNFDGTLPPGGTVVFGLPPEFLDIVLSVVASLSPEQFGVKVVCFDTELVSIAGSALGEVLEQHAG